MSATDFSGRGGPALARRKRRGAAFQWVCLACTWTALLLLVVLLFTLLRDSLSYLASRTDTSPYAVGIMLKHDPQFIERAELIAPGIAELWAPFDPAELEAAGRESIAAAAGEAEAEAARAQLALELSLAREDYFTAQEEFLIDLKAADSAAFAQLGLRISATQRLSVWSKVLWRYLNSYPSRNAPNAGIKSAIAGSLWMLALTALLAIPVGVLAAIYLEEYARQNKVSRFIEVNISNLAGVPSIVYGLLGLTAFVGFFAGMKSKYPDSELLVNPNNLIAGSLTMALLILPVIIIASREAIKAVPASLRQAAYAVGATRWQVVSQHVLPAAIPGIVTGVILSMSRAIGETAPLITIGALTYVAFVPKTPLDGFTVLPIQIYNWISRPQEEFHSLAAIGIVVLMVFLLAMNSIAVAIRHHYERKVKW